MIKKFSDYRVNVTRKIKEFHYFLVLENKWFSNVVCDIFEIYS